MKKNIYQNWVNKFSRNYLFYFFVFFIKIMYFKSFTLEERASPGNVCTYCKRENVFLSLCFPICQQPFRRAFAACAFTSKGLFSVSLSDDPPLRSLSPFAAQIGLLRHEGGGGVRELCISRKTATVHLLSLAILKRFSPPCFILIYPRIHRTRQSQSHILLAIFLFRISTLKRLVLFFSSLE